MRSQRGTFKSDARTYLALILGGAFVSVYLRHVEVEAGRSWVSICHTSQSHVVSFHQKDLSDDLQDDVLCGVCEVTKTEEDGV